MFTGLLFSGLEGFVLAALQDIMTLSMLTR